MSQKKATHVHELLLKLPDVLYARPVASLPSVGGVSHTNARLLLIFSVRYYRLDDGGPESKIYSCSYWLFIST